MKANIQGVSLKIQTLRSQNAMAQAMKGVTRAMGNMNRQLNLPQIQKIMMVSDYELFPKPSTQPPGILHSKIS